jgi:transcriptional regulator with GAF, ATPase, and Fis domain
MPRPRVAERTQLEALNHITFAINATLDVDQIFLTIERELSKLLSFDWLSFALLHPRRTGRMRLYESALTQPGDQAADMKVPIHGTLAEVMSLRRSVIVESVDPAKLDAEDPLGPATRTLGIRTVVCIPLVAKAELIGTLNLASTLPLCYQTDDLPLLQQVAAQLALAIDKARLLMEERRRAEQLRLLNEVAKEVVSSLDKTTLISRVVNEVHHAFDFVHLSAFLLDTSRRECRLIATAGRWHDSVPLGWTMSLDEGVIGRAMRDARPYLAEDTASDPYYLPLPGVDSQTELVVPIIARGQVLGCLNAESHLPRAFDAEDIQTLSTIADQLASGIVNADLYAEITGFNRVLEDQVRQKVEELTLANREIAKQKELLARENVHLRATLHRRGDDLVGDSRALASLLQVVGKVAPSEATVLIQGESGTGKELVAARIHRLSARSDGPYVTINCGALPQTLLESELFGHEAGSFTGADRRKPGLVETAEKGTLLLDEIGELPLTLQAKLLRFLQEGEFYRIGGKRPLQADVRVLAATNRDLRQEVAKGKFREDLFFRVNAITLEVPPLRERASDIPKLANYFLERCKGGRDLRIGTSLMSAIVDYPWPGNVRELANLIERLAILGEDGELGLEFVPSHVLDGAARRTEAQNAPGAAKSEATRTAKPLREMEREHIRWALAKNRGDKAKTARELGIALKTLYNKIARYKL